MKRIIGLAVALVTGLAAGAVAPAGATPAASQENVRHVTTVPGSTGGHSVVEGDRLYVGAYGLGLTVFDVSDPADPQKIGEYKPGPQDGSDPGLRADAVPDAAEWEGRHIVTLNGTGRTSGTQQTEFLDMTDPENPVLLHRFTGSSEGEAHNGDIADQARLWLPSGGRSGDGLRIYDMRPLLEDPPRAPERIFAGNPHSLWLDSEYRERTGKPAGAPFNHTHDLEIYENLEILLPEWEWETDGASNPIPTFAERDIVLLAASTGYALGGPGANDGAAYIIDITDPTDPVVINKWHNPGEDSDQIRYFHEVQFLDGDPSTMVVADEDLHSGCDSGRLYTVRVSQDLLEAEKLAEWTIGSGQADAPLCAGSHVFSSRDRYLFMGAYVSGLQVIDLRDPASPARAGRYIAEGANYWGALYHDGVVYAGDFGGRGLDVFEFIPEPDAQGLVKAMDPVTRVVGGVTEQLGECNPESPVNGFDGLIVPIPEDKQDGTHTIRAVTGNADPGEEIDIWFYDFGCNYISGSGLNSDNGGVESGRIPDFASYAVVTLWTGASDFVYAKIDPAQL